MGEPVVAERKTLAASLSTLGEYQWMFLRNIWQEVTGSFGEAGIGSLERGLWRYGYYRGEQIRNDPRVLAGERDCLAFLDAFDGPEFALCEQVVLDGTATDLTATLPSVPGADYLVPRGCGSVLRLFWPQVLSGLAAGYDPSLVVDVGEVPTDGTSAWSLRLRMDGAAPSRPAEALTDPIGDRVRYILLARKTTALIAAAEMYVARELIHAFDASGEEAIRRACYGYGVERGLDLRDRVAAAGGDFDFLGLRSAVDARDPLNAVFAIGGEVYHSPALDFYDCTYCPLAEVWAKEGPAGLALGYLFDMEFHRGLVETYHPGGVVKWDALKTRGDSVCRFRFVIPELVTEAEQPLVWREPLREPQGGPVQLRPPSAGDSSRTAPR